MNDQTPPLLHDIPIGIDATGQRHETDAMGGIDVSADPGRQRENTSACAPS
jgi:fumarate hydratase, class II